MRLNSAAAPATVNDDKLLFATFGLFEIFGKVKVKMSHKPGDLPNSYDESFRRERLLRIRIQTVFEFFIFKSSELKKVCYFFYFTNLGTVHKKIK